MLRQTSKKKDERPPTFGALPGCAAVWSGPRTEMEEGLPKSGAQLQGAENGAAYACARGMDGEKKLLHTPPPTALPCCIYYCTTAVDRTAARLYLAIAIDIRTACHTSTTVPSTYLSTLSPPPPPHNQQPPPLPPPPYPLAQPPVVVSTPEP